MPNLLVTKLMQKQESKTSLPYVQAAFSQIAGSLGPSQLGQGSSGAEAGAGPSSAPSAVVDLGVVGRGTKRVTPLPMPTLPPTAGCHALLAHIRTHCNNPFGPTIWVENTLTNAIPERSPLAASMLF